MRKYLVFALFLTGAPMGCAETPTYPTVASLAGTWTLRTVNGAPVPVTRSGAEADRVDLTSGSITLSADGIYSETVNVTTFTSSQPISVALTEVGILTRDGSRLTFTPIGSADPQTTTLFGNSFWRVFDGATLVYVKPFITD